MNDETEAVEPMRDTTSSSVAKRQCGAKTRSGAPCPTPPIKGGTRCRMHGGAAPQVKRKAQMKMMELREPALAQLVRIVNDRKASDADKLKAIKLVLDRTDPVGLKLSAEVKLEPWQAMLGGVARATGRELDPGFEERLDEYDANELRERVRQLERELRQARSIEARPVTEYRAEPEPTGEAVPGSVEARASVSGQPDSALTFEAETPATYGDSAAAAQSAPDDDDRAASRRVEDAQAAQRAHYRQTGERRHMGDGSAGVPAGECMCEVNRGYCAVHRPPSVDTRFRKMHRR